MISCSFRSQNFFALVLTLVVQKSRMGSLGNFSNSLSRQIELPEIRRFFKMNLRLIFRDRND